MTSTVTPRQIVPVATPREAEAVAPAALSAHLTYHGGPLLTSVQVVTVFWGAAWEQAPQDALVTELNQFFDFIVTSALMDLLAEYSVSGSTIGPGSRIGSVTITDSEPGTLQPGGGREVTDGDIQQALQGWLNSDTVPTATANTLYFIYLPPNVTSVLGNDKSCSVFCGYHGTFNDIFYAVEPYVTCDGCTHGGILDTLTEISSHELCEAITDPALNGWFDDSSGDEIGDICNARAGQFGSYTIQSEWSNAANACIMPPTQ